MKRSSRTMALSLSLSLALTLCVVDNRPRDLSEEDRRALDDLAALVEKELG